MATNWITLTVSVVSTVRPSTIRSIGTVGVITIRFTTILIITRHGTTLHGHLAGRLAGVDSIPAGVGVGITHIMAGAMVITHHTTVDGTAEATMVAGTAAAITAAAVTTTITEEVMLMANAVQQVPMYTVEMQAADHHLQQQFRLVTTDADQAL